VKKNKPIVRIQFASQLKAYREAAGISQENLAQAMGIQQPYIARIENAEVGIGIENMAEISACFGKSYFDFANPDLPIPPQKVLVKSLKEHLTAKGIDASYLDNGTPPKYAHLMDIYLSLANLAEPKTTYDIAREYNGMFEGMTITPSKVSDILSHDRRKEQVVKSRAGKYNQYRLKRPDD
jgi:transcriptional regulator with XRE-family HTH domain